MLKVRNLSKRYKENPYVLTDINFSISKGEIVGLVGKNGTGKTTLLKMIAESVRPTSGSILYKGKDVFLENNVLDPFGIMIQPVFYNHMTVYQNLIFYLEIHGCINLIEKIEPVLKLVELWEECQKKPHNFSFGMKQRLSLAISLVIEPEFIILDEPFVGLDPDGVNQLIAILKKWTSENKVSMLISSHQLNELEVLCHRCLFIENQTLRSIENQGEPVTYIKIRTVLKNVKELEQRFAIKIFLESPTEIKVFQEIKYINDFISYLFETYEVDSIKENQFKLADLFEKGASR